MIWNECDLSVIFALSAVQIERYFYFRERENPLYNGEGPIMKWVEKRTKQDLNSGQKGRIVMRRKGCEEVMRGE